MGAVSNSIVSGNISKPTDIVMTSAVSCVSSATNELLFSTVLPQLQAGQYFTVETQWNMTNSANTKGLLVQFGGQDITNLSLTTNAGFHNISTIVIRAGNTQVCTNKSTSSPWGVTSSSGSTALTVDTSVPVTLAIYGNRSNVGDVLSLDFCVVRF